MATNFQTEVQLKINDVESEDVLADMVAKGQIESFGIYVTPEEESSTGGGSKITWREWN